MIDFKIEMSGPTVVREGRGDSEDESSWRPQEACFLNVQSPVDACGRGFACFRIAISRLNAGNFRVQMLAHPTELIKHFDTRPYPPVISAFFPIMPVEKALSEGASRDLSELDWLQKIDSFTEA